MSLLETENDKNLPNTGSAPSQDQTSVIKFAKEGSTDAAAMPSLFGAGYGTYGVRPENFYLSFFTHVVAVGLMLFIYHLLAHQNKAPDKEVWSAVPLEPYIPNHVGKQAGGGGGGGEASKLKASAGSAPKATMKQQITPPTVLEIKQPPKLAVQPTIVADLKIPQTNQVGDSLSKLMVPSGGTGITSGIGTGSGGGVGSGNGRGYGPGEGANFGGGVFKVGNGVSAPKAIFTPDPDYSDEARKSKYQGTVTLNVIIGADGRVHNASVIRSLGMGLDEKALEKVKTWTFDPATKDGKPVAVQLSIEVAFNLY